MPLAVILFDAVKRVVRHGRASSACRISGAPNRPPVPRVFFEVVVAEKDAKGRVVSWFCEIFRVMREGRAKRVEGREERELRERSRVMSEGRSPKVGGREVSLLSCS